MIARVLDQSEWDKIPAEAKLRERLDYMNSDNVDVIVVEDAGKVVACWSVMRQTWLEGCYIVPEYRGNAGAVRRLMRKTYSVASQWGDRFLWTGAVTDCVRELIERLGGKEVPMSVHVLPLRAGKEG